MSEPKNIVVCCDGTGNQFGDCNSNVVKLYRALVIDDAQRGYYHPGVGTMGAPAARTWLEEKWSVLKGMAFGAGLLANVGDAYRYLMDVYSPGDNVYLFGFSRGAYTARALAGVLHMYGLLTPGNDGLIPYITRMFAKRSRKEGGMTATFDVAAEFKRTFSRDCPLHFVGVWDTVSSVGWVYNPVKLPYSARNPGIRTGRHAVAVHERRCFYRQNLWGEPFAGQDLKQVWFTGVHSDIGGSYPEAESGLSKVTLEWMLAEAQKAGLRLDPRETALVLGRDPTHPEWTQPDPSAAIHNSLKGFWWVLELFPHQYYDFQTGQIRCRIPMGRPRRIQDGATIYEPAVSRVPPGRLPARYSVEPAARLGLTAGQSSGS